MAQVPGELLSAWQQHPCEPVRLIVRVAGDLAHRQAEISALGGVVSHAFRLTNALSLACPGSVALRLAQQPWVLSISLDTPVQALGRQTHG
jgi:hypothetical protein